MKEKQHGALWAYTEDKKKMDVMIIKLGYTTSSKFFQDLAKVKTKDLKALLNN